MHRGALPVDIGHQCGKVKKRPTPKKPTNVHPSPPDPHPRPPAISEGIRVRQSPAVSGDPRATHTGHGSE
eukprot:5977196-Alexandrium_andersonii.AAC.1